MAPLPPGEIDKLSQAAALLHQAERPLRILKNIAWPKEISQTFFENGARELPDPHYVPVDPRPVREAVAAARTMIDGSSPVHDWLERTATVLELSAGMLASVGTAEFTRWSVDLFGAPSIAHIDQKARPIDLARNLDTVLSEFDHCDLTSGRAPHVLTAQELSARMEPRIRAVFGGETPPIHIVDTLSAKAVASGSYIKLRADAEFSDLDTAQLVQHEAFVHIATSYNGRAQTTFPILGAGHPGTTRTQEGLAVLAELVSGVNDPARMRRLADRVLAIDMATEGADFLDLYRFFLERTGSETESFENARRVVRGGLVTGGAPFTKDGVYLGGLIRVYNYMRAAVTRGEARHIRLLFAGKFDLDDMPAILALEEHGLIEPPRYLPPWAEDLRALVSYLAFARFIGDVDLASIDRHYDDLLGKGSKTDGAP